MTTPEEAQANREKFLQALVDPANQKCNGALFEDRTGDDGTTKHFRCAVGVAVSLFFGINTEAEYHAYLRENTDFRPYEAVAEKLGFPDTAEGHILDNEVDRIWMLNDRGRSTFKSIARELKKRWATL